MKMPQESKSAQNPRTSNAPHLTSVPSHIEEWLDDFFDGRPSVQFSCTPEFYNQMILRLKEAANEHGYDADLVVGLRGTLEFHSRSEGQKQRPESAQKEVPRDSSRFQEQSAELLSAEELITRIDALRHQIERDSARRKKLATEAVAAGIKKSWVYSNAGITLPTLNKWLNDKEPDKKVREPDRRLVLRRLQVVNSQIRSSTRELRRLGTEAAIATGNVARVARVAGLSREAIYRWLRTRSPRRYAMKSDRERLRHEVSKRRVAGESIADIASSFGLHPSTLGKWFQKWEVQPASGKHGRSLAPNQWRRWTHDEAVIAYTRTDLSIAERAAILGRSYTSVAGFVRAYRQGSADPHGLK